eukprot:Skav227729  [mRNA]  locus=scaffold5201:2314:4795:- [translate_table: standard]
MGSPRSETPELPSSFANSTGCSVAKAWEFRIQLSCWRRHVKNSHPSGVLSILAATPAGYKPNLAFQVAEVGMTYILLALVVLCARTGGCYMAIHAADRQAIPMYPTADTHLFRDGIGERLVDFSRAVAMALSASALACTRDWKISILMAVVMPIAGLCMALSVEVVRNFSMVVEACYAKAGEVTATELIKTVTAFNGQRAELESFNGHVDEASGTAIQSLGWELLGGATCEAFDVDLCVWEMGYVRRLEGEEPAT